MTKSVDESTGVEGYCINCGAAFGAGQRFCGGCGVKLANRPGEAGSAVPMPNETTQPASDHVGITENDPPYPREAIIGAVLLTVFVPFIALVMALVLRVNEARPKRRELLRNWAIASGAWLATGWLIAVIAIGSIASTISPSCQGGIDQTVPPSYQSSDGVHWTGTFTCMNGGTITKPVPANQVPGGSSP